MYVPHAIQASHRGMGDDPRHGFGRAIELIAPSRGSPHGPVSYFPKRSWAIARSSVASASIAATGPFSNSTIRQPNAVNRQMTASITINQRQAIITKKAVKKIVMPKKSQGNPL